MDFKTITRPVQDDISPDNLLKGQLLWMLLLRVVLYTLLIGISFFLQNGQHEFILPPYYWLLFFICCVYLSAIGSAYFLLTCKGESHRFGLFQNQLDIFLVTILVYATGSSYSPFS